jgi:hypothetical protein
MDASTEQDSSLEPKDLTGGDYGFIVFILLVLVAVTMLGVLGQREAMKTEGSKRNGEQWVNWLTKASETRFAPDYAIAACAGGAKPAAPAAAPAAGDDAKPADAPAAEQAAAAPAPGTWGACVAHLMSATEFKDMVNPFTGAAPNFIPACNPADHTLVGSIVIEKITPNPPGSAVATVTSQLVDADLIAEKLALKVSVCDKGSYAVKVAEIEF